MPANGLTDFKPESILTFHLRDFVVRPEISTCSLCSGTTFSIPTGVS